MPAGHKTDHAYSLTPRTCTGPVNQWLLNTCWLHILAPPHHPITCTCPTIPGALLLLLLVQVTWLVVTEVRRKSFGLVTECRH